MHAAEIVISEVQGDSRFQVRQLLAVRIREPRESPHCRAPLGLSQGLFSGSAAKLKPFDRQLTDRRSLARRQSLPHRPSDPALLRI